MKKATTAKKPPEKVGNVEVGKELKRTNQVYMTLSKLGEVDAKGKSIFSMGYSGKVTAPPDRGLLLLIMLLDELKQFIQYSSNEAAEYDLEMLKKHINVLHFNKEPKSAKRSNSDGV